MSAVRLDPFRRIVGVSWPPTGLAVTPFRATLTTNYDAGGTLSYSASMQFLGDVTPLVLVLDQLRVTTSGLPIPTTISSVTYNPGDHPARPTPGGFTNATTPGTFTPARPDVPPILFELVRAGSPLLTVDVTGWTLTTQTFGPFPGPSSFRIYARLAP